MNSTDVPCKSYALLECLGGKFRAAVRGHKRSVCRKNIRSQARCHQNQGRKGFAVFLDGEVQARVSLRQIRRRQTYLQVTRWGGGQGGAIYCKENIHKCIYANCFYESKSVCNIKMYFVQTFPSYSLKCKLPNPPLVILQKGFSTLVLLTFWTKLFFVVRGVLCI